MPADGSIGAPADPSRWRGARAWFQTRRPVLRESAAQTERDARLRAFRVAGITSVNLITEVHQAIDDAIANGETLDEFKKRVGAKLAEAWGAPNARRVETIFRTNVQSAYNAGRYAEMTRPAVLAVRPFWKFVAILDERTTGTCSPLNGTIVRHDDAFWRTHFPPLHFNCRSTVVSLSRGEAERAGGAKKPPDAKAPAEGFGTRPDLAGDELEPSAQASPATREVFESRQRSLTPAGYRVDPTPPMERRAIPEVEDYALATEVSRAIAVLDGDHAGAVRDALAAVAKVHRDGVLPVIEATTEDLPEGTHAHYVRALGHPAAIAVAKTTLRPRLEFLHELGHFIDDAGHGVEGIFSSESETLFAALMNAIHATPTAERLRAMRDGRYRTRSGLTLPTTASERDDVRETVRYMLENRELFARAYAQFISVESGDPSLLRELEHALAEVGGAAYGSQWSHEEFEPVRTAFRSLFERLRWRASRDVGAGSDG